jgi:hypothetical protein
MGIVLDTVEVSGSSPLGPTMPVAGPLQFAAASNRYGRWTSSAICDASAL